MSRLESKGSWGWGTIVLVALLSGPGGLGCGETASTPAGDRESATSGSGSESTQADSADAESRAGTGGSEATSSKSLAMGDGRYVKFPMGLPKVIATVDGKPIDRSELHDLIIRRHQKLSFARYTIFHGTVLEHAMKQRNVTTTEAEVDACLEETLTRSGGDLEALLESKRFDLAYLRRQLRAIVNIRKYAVAMGLYTAKTVDHLQPTNAQLLDDVCLEHEIQLVNSGIPEDAFAIVDGEKVLKSDLLQWSCVYLRVGELKKLIDELVAARLDEFLLERYEIEVPVAEIDREYEENSHKRGGSVPYEFALALELYTVDSFRAFLERTLGVREILALEPTEEQLRRFVEMFRDAIGFGAAVRIRDLFIPEIDFREEGGLEPTEASWAGAKARIDEAWAELEAGAAFDEAFVKRFVTKKGRRGKHGDLDWLDMTASRFMPLRDRGFGMEVGEVSGPFKATHGYHIITVLDKRPGTETFEELMSVRKSRGLIRRQFKVRGRKVVRALERDRHEVVVKIDWDTL